ncbi:MAG: lasso peptide biosynthesis B2 protein [Lachnospiraceae bacterium]|nr:lasso peptide biosynthesis B2 protein [Lachnospiraceae bacterium]
MGIIAFLRWNTQKRLTLLSYIYSAFFSFEIRFIKSKYLRKGWGLEGVESPETVEPWKYRYARNVAYVVDRICTKTAWESKCLVRALTAQKLLKAKGISSTMYLGCGYDEGKMVAHAWLRCGKMYVTGGDGSNYSIVDKFAVMWNDVTKD